MAHDDWYRTRLQIASESRFVDVAGDKIHYLVWQPSDERRQPVLMFVHGMRGHAHWWDFVAPWFVAGFRVLAIDLSGMGDSAHRRKYDCDTFVRDIVAVIETETDMPAVLVGHSFGGSRVLTSIIARPDLFAHAIVVDSMVLMKNDELLGRIARTTGRVYPDRAGALARFRLQPEQPVCSEVLRQHVAEHSVREIPGGWTWKFDPALTDADTALDPALLGRVRTPVDFIHGEHSAAVSAERATRIARAVPTTRSLIGIPGGHHHLMLDQPVALVSTLRALLARR